MTIMAPVGSTNKLAFVMPIAFKAKLARPTDGLKRNSQRMEAAAALVPIVPAKAVWNQLIRRSFMVANRAKTTPATIVMAAKATT